MRARGARGEGVVTRGVVMWYGGNMGEAETLQKSNGVRVDGRGRRRRGAGVPINAMTIEERRRDVARLLTTRAMTSYEVAVELGISQGMAARDMVAVREAWRRETITDMDVVMARDLAELGMVKAEAWWCYEESIQVGDEIVTEAEVLTRGEEVQMLTTKVSRNPKASLDALRLVTSCIDKRRKILGLDHEEMRRGGGKRISFTVKIGDRVLVSEASTADPGDILDAEVVELDSSGKALPSETESE